MYSVISYDKYFYRMITNNHTEAGAKLEMQSRKNKGHMNIYREECALPGPLPPEAMTKSIHRPAKPQAVAR